MRIAWITDPHLNHCSLPSWERLLEETVSSQCDAVLLTGDISEGDDVVFQLERLAGAIQKPIFFVLGNHDYYQSSISQTRRAVSDAADKHPLLHYLRDESLISFSPSVALVGEDGWGDGVEGDYEGSIVSLNDFRLIDDFRNASPTDWKETLRTLGREAAQRITVKLSAACATHSSILIATHVPPFRESCWYEGHTTDDNWAPFFVCGQLGRALRAVAQENPLVKFHVVCGHTHHGGVAQLLPNLTVVTGPAVYGHPKVTDVIILSHSIVFTSPTHEQGAATSQPDA